jgi:hypothetical protein
VVCGPLEPDQDPATAAVLLSGRGSTGPPRLSPPSLAHLQTLGFLPRDREPDEVTAQQLLRRVRGRDQLWAIGSTDGPLVVVARARLDQLSQAGDRFCPISSAAAARRRHRALDTHGRLWRDLRLTRVALTSALRYAREKGRQRMAATLLAAGDLRTASPSFVLVEMLRAWAEFLQRQDMSLTLHVDDVVELDLVSGRVDVDRLLTDGPQTGRRPVEFWVEIVPSSGDADRTLVMDVLDRPLLDVLAEFGFAGRAEGWWVPLEPVPCLAWESWTLVEIRARQQSAQGDRMTLERFGVLHGSTLRLSRSR